jgi:hypothetical protein
MGHVQSPALTDNPAVVVLSHVVHADPSLYDARPEDRHEEQVNPTHVPASIAWQGA